METVSLPSKGVEKGNSYRRTLLKRFLRHRLALVGCISFLAIIIIALIAPFIAPHHPFTIYSSYLPPGSEHWLGTDQSGRDVFSRLLYASRISLIVGVGTVFIYIIIGTILGALAGFFGGWLDMLVMRITDVFLSFPYLMVILVLVSIVGPNLSNIILVLGILGWPGVARLVRGNVLSLKNSEFVRSGIALGFSKWRLLFNHILPNSIAPILVNATFGVAFAILTEASLSFLGMGVQPPTASWGNMLSEAQSISILADRPWLWLPPGIMIVIVVLSINFIGDGIRDAMDPKNSQ
ncbi:dipeptide ABC transporter permease protein [Bacillus sp. TS-2]|nr:dipeptide ABC transporter permease protein [Bacillus sp. TS-2]